MDGLSKGIQLRVEFGYRLEIMTLAKRNDCISADDTTVPLVPLKVTVLFVENFAATLIGVPSTNATPQPLPPRPPYRPSGPMDRIPVRVRTIDAVRP